MKLLKVCKSGFLHKTTKIISEYSSDDFDEDVMIQISSLDLHPEVTGGVTMVLKINIPFLEAYQILDKIIRYAHTIPTLDFVQFCNVYKSDLYALTATVLKSYQSIPFKVKEICYYPKNFCFDAYITMDNPEYVSRYMVRDRWSGLFQRLFETNKFNVVLSEV